MWPLVRRKAQETGRAVTLALCSPHEAPPSLSPAASALRHPLRPPFLLPPRLHSSCGTALRPLPSGLHDPPPVLEGALPLLTAGSVDLGCKPGLTLGLAVHKLCVTSEPVTQLLCAFLFPVQRAGVLMAVLFQGLMRGECVSQVKCLAWRSSACGLDVRAEVLPTLSPACCPCPPEVWMGAEPTPSVRSWCWGVGEQVKSYCTALVGAPASV